MARITASVYTSHVPAIGAALDLGKSQEPYWQPVFKGYEFSKTVDEGQQARRDLPGLQRPRHRVQPGHDPDLRHRHGRRVQAGRRRLGPAAGAQGDRPSGAGRAHRAVGDPAGLRPDHRQQDGRGPRPDRAAVADVRPAAGLALPGDPVRGERGAVPGAVGPALLEPGQGHPQGGRELRRGPQGADLGHRRHEPPVAGPARRPDQPRVRQRVPRPADRRPGRPGGGAAHRLRARGRQRRHRAGDVADRPRRHGRRGRRRAAQGRAPLLPCARVATRRWAI